MKKKNRRREIIALDIDEVLKDMPAIHYNESNRLKEAGGPQLPIMPDFQKMEKEWLEKLDKIFNNV
ncbi:MAG: hypothetical protein Q7R92_00090 [bacterium]|nr:hypothetical protein [bacterium]